MVNCTPNSYILELTMNTIHVHTVLHIIYVFQILTYTTLLLKLFVVRLFPFYCLFCLLQAHPGECLCRLASTKSALAFSTKLNAFFYSSTWFLCECVCAGGRTLEKYALLYVCRLVVVKYITWVSCNLFL